MGHRFKWLCEILNNDHSHFAQQIIFFPAREFYIGGYLPVQKWLKDLKGRVLSYEDIQHYQKIIGASVETDRLMKEIDSIEIVF